MVVEEEALRLLEVMQRQPLAVQAELELHHLFLVLRLLMREAAEVVLIIEGQLQEHPVVLEVEGVVEHYRQTELVVMELLILVVAVVDQHIQVRFGMAEQAAPVS